MTQFISHSAKETFDLAYDFGKQLPPNTVLCFYGELGAGKTTFIKGLTAGALGTGGDEVNSPTFNYLNIYKTPQNLVKTHKGVKALYHFDLYRLTDADEFLSMGFDETFDAGGICCIEWAERLTPIEIPNAKTVAMTHLSDDSRAIEIRS